MRLYFSFGSETGLVLNPLFYFFFWVCWSDLGWLREGSACCNHLQHDVCCAFDLEQQDICFSCLCLHFVPLATVCSPLSRSSSTSSFSHPKIRVTYAFRACVYFLTQAFFAKAALQVPQALLIVIVADFLKWKVYVHRLSTVVGCRLHLLHSLELLGRVINTTVYGCVCVWSPVWIWICIC